MKRAFTIVLICLCFFKVNAQLVIDSTQGDLKLKFGNLIRLSGPKGYAGTHPSGRVKVSVDKEVVILGLTSTDSVKPNTFSGVFFPAIPHLKQGVTLWRYKPWNSWSKPVAITDAAKIADWDVQFFYWQYDDGLYGAAVPLSGNGFRTTLGSMGDRWGSKAVSYGPGAGTREVPGMAVAFGKDPFELFKRVYQSAMNAMGKGENLASLKTMPLPLQYIGWCTWNSSNLGKDLGEQQVLTGVKTFTDHNYKLGWVLIDDGWFQHQNSQLQSLVPDVKKFPNGFKPLINQLKNRMGVRYVGVWHAFDGYWNGIDPNSALGQQYKDKLFSWRQSDPGAPDSLAKKYYFVKPEGDNLYNFYSSMHSYLKGEGFDFVKVDNQLVTERMAVDNYPINILSEKMHRALYKSVNKYFNGAIINCMDMTAEAYTNFGSSAVARAVEDYFPYEKGETYNLQKGNAAAHVLQAVYNSIYFSQMVFPDFDMFQSHNPNAVFHALARTLNNGPIYLTDVPGKQNFGILKKISFADGRSVRSQTALLPTEDCLFQVQAPKLFKAYSRVGNTGLLVLYNAADADEVGGDFKAGDVNGLSGNQFAVYEYFSGKLRLANGHEGFHVHLARMGYQLQYIVPVKSGFAPFGLINKYNAPAAILTQNVTHGTAEIILYEGGTFKGYCKSKPKAVFLNGVAHTFIYQNNMITITVPPRLQKPAIKIIL